MTSLLDQRADSSAALLPKLFFLNEGSKGRQSGTH
uniref:Uncharacterized protein n=1 Tax=Anguilla anguilla TaxID=7936 RepID=A0A0E9RL83_ANGAN